MSAEFIASAVTAYDIKTRKPALEMRTNGSSATPDDARKILMEKLGPSYKGIITVKNSLNITPPSTARNFDSKSISTGLLVTRDINEHFKKR